MVPLVSPVSVYGLAEVVPTSEYVLVEEPLL